MKKIRPYIITVFVTVFILFLYDCSYDFMYSRNSEGYLETYKEEAIENGDTTIEFVDNITIDDTDYKGYSHTKHLLSIVGLLFVVCVLLCSLF